MAATKAAPKKRSQFEEVWRRLKKNKMAMFGLALDEEKARAYFESTPPSDRHTCSMCGKMCAVRTTNMILEGKTADVIVLSNWSGKQLETELTLNNVPAYCKFNASGVKLLKSRRENGKLILTLSVPAGGCIECIK